MQPVQDIQIGTRVSRTQFQYTLIDTDAAELALWAPRLLAKLATLPELRDVATDQQDEGFATDICVDRDAAMRLGVTMQAVEDTLYDAFGQRQISTIFGQANQYRVVLEADPAWQAESRTSCGLLRVPGTDRRAGAAVRHRTHRARPPRRWSSRIRSNSPRSRSASTWRPATRSAMRCDAVARGRARHRHAGNDQRQLWSGDAAEFQRLARRPSRG